jgi:signal transduction histidine kinase
MPPSPSTENEPLSLATPVALMRKMSHDLRGPLSAITATSELFEEGAYGEVSEKQERAIQRIYRNGMRLTTILDHLILYITGESRDYPLYVQPFDPRAVLDAVVDQVKPALANRPVAIEITIGKTLPANLTGDVAAIRQILLALLWNAVGFTREGTIQVVSKWSTRTGWTIRVIDTGIGITPEAAPHIFEPFWRGAQTVVRVPSAGSGLGLAAARALTAIMSGRLKLEQSTSAGSTFRLTLPLKK